MIKATAALAGALVSTFAVASIARAESYPVLVKYEAKASALVGEAKAATLAELPGLVTGTRELVNQGLDVMRLYAEKNPICAAQYEVIYQEAAMVEQQSLEAVHARYHNGEGLPTAPKHCYLGRSQFVHPALNLIRMQGTWTESVRTDVIDDLEEVVEHVAKIQKNLDTPPN